MKKFIAPVILLFFCNITPTIAQCINPVEMDFFNKISGVLEIQLSEEPHSLKGLPGNKFADEKSKLVSLKLKPEIYLDETESYRQLTQKELNAVAYNKPLIELVSESGIAVTHKASNDRYFTVKDLLNAVEVTELKTRGNSDWFGGIDVHHIYFEGIYCEGGKRLIFWGS